MRIVVTIEARMASTRLPGKVLRPILGKPMLARMVERVRRAAKIHDIVIATTVNPKDDVIVHAASVMGVGIYRGSEEDVLARVLKTAEFTKADLIVELTGDCPLADPEIIDRAVGMYLASSFDYVSNAVERTYPRGLDTQVFSTETLQDVSKKTQDPADRENVSLYIYEHPHEYRLGHFHAEAEIHYPEYRWTVDTPEDFEFISRIYEALYPSHPAFRSADVVRYLQAHPEVIAINQKIQQKKVR